MPQLRFHGVTPARLAPVSRQLLDRLAEVTATARDDFTLECIASTFIFDGEEAPPFPFVEVLWFERGDAVRDACAAAITQALSDSGLNEVEVFFIALDKRSYYARGQHFADH
ncbi:DUF1904 family protein [Phytohalomonas tamaricis]|uniref:DUF1904 family protein n=1 Tax=Phytohalomonas tamaricis TaxID=2081032 RepID=UPI000D0BB800|nr:DUF1904 family protein [Phytohalomonas tamaricis]